MEKIVRVALKITHNDGILSYRIKDADTLGDLFGRRVIVRVRNKPMTGVIIGDDETIGSTVKIKDVERVIDEFPVLTTEQFALMKFCAGYYFNALGTCIQMSIPRNEKAFRPLKEKSIKKQDAAHLSLEQQAAVDAIIKERSGAFLLEGVTGSGKTHVYMSVAETTLNEGRAVLIVVPEISLTKQLVDRVQSSLGERAVMIHSNITPQNKRDAIFALISGQARVLIGARSAIFAPFKDLGLIIIDEEHDASLKQDESPQYHARDLALWRARNIGARVILGSATPSLESIVNVQRQKLMHLSLSQRYGNSTLPTVSIIDLKERANDVDFRTQDQSVSPGQKMCILSRPLLTAMKETLADSRQVLLFLNQRGYAKFGVCNDCGQLVACPNCSVSLTYYQHRRCLLCHQCKHTETAHTICRNCRRDAVRFLGLGTERLEDEVRALFPDYRVVRLDRDVVRSNQRLNDTLTAMHEREAHILIGTQMIAKGHDFLHVGLVGVICADIGLSMPDFRAAEKTFQLLTQVAGRAGRGSQKGHAMIQTFNPAHPSILFAKDHNVHDFIRQELAVRKRFMQPPFTRAALIRCEHSDQEIAETIISSATMLLKREKALTILGPVPSPIEKVNLRFRFQCMALATEPKILHDALMRLTNDTNITSLVNKKKARFVIDIDPHDLT